MWREQPVQGSNKTVERYPFPIGDNTDYNRKSDSHKPKGGGSKNSASKSKDETQKKNEKKSSRGKELYKEQLKKSTNN